MERSDLARAMAAIVVVAWLLPSCGGEELPLTLPDEQPTGPEGCMPGEAPLENGSCLPAGIPPEACADGFVSTGNGGCMPQLPNAPCGPGQMAVPGETTCHSVAPCPEGTWGDIAIEATTQFVDASFSGTSDGTQSSPWQTIGEAITAAAPGAIVAVAAGTYDEDVEIHGKPVRLWGRCPGLVQVKGIGGLAAVLIRNGADGAQVRGLAVTGPMTGITMTGAGGIVVDQVWVHDTGTAGFFAAHDLGPSDALLSRSLIERAGDFGIIVRGTILTVDASVVRDGQPGGQSGDGGGIGVHYDAVAQQRGAVTVLRSLLERNRQFGAAVSRGIRLQRP